MTKILILGATGLAGQAVTRACLQRGHDVRTASRSGSPEQVDISDAADLGRLLEASTFDVLINCAALVDIDACEKDRWNGWKTNALPMAAMSEWANKTGARLVHISTDHYYNDGGAAPHAETQPVTFANAYARQKFAGECFALNAQEALVVRTNIVGFRRWERATFAEWAFDLIEHDRPATLFSDAYTSSIDVGTFAGALLDLIEKRASGLINLAAGEVYSKYDFVWEIAGQLGRPLTRQTVGSVSSLRVKRASCLGLDVRKAEALLGHRLPTLREVAGSLVSEYKAIHHAL